jgi:hypothetical protein
VPGFAAAGVLFTGTGTAARIAEDKSGGLTDRLR